MPDLTLEALTTHHVGPVDLTIAAGRCTVLHGPSGAGKSLLLRAIADIDPHEGSVRLGDTACEAIPAPLWRSRVGLLSAESRWWYPTVGPHFPAGTIPQAQSLGFAADVANWEIRRLSTGERQRLALLRLLAHQPQALLLDEPTASLDPDSVLKVEGLVAAYRAEQQAPVLWVSHDPAQMGRVGDAVVHIKGGKLL